MATVTPQLMPSAERNAESVLILVRTLRKTHERALVLQDELLALGEMSR